MSSVRNRYYRLSGRAWSLWRRGLTRLFRPTNGIAERSRFPYRAFADVFRAVAAGEVEFGLVPVENSQAGSINDVYDLLRQHDLFVIGEIGHPVNHCLLCLPGQPFGDIKRVISIRRPWRRCDVYLRELGVEIVATYDTAGSAKMIREEQLTGWPPWPEREPRNSTVGDTGAQYPDH